MHVANLFMMSDRSTPSFLPTQALEFCKNPRDTLDSQTLNFLSQSFLDTLSPQPDVHRLAEKNLSAAADTPNYGLAVLHFVASLSVDVQIRQCAAINLKNHLKTRWVPSPSSSPRISDDEKTEIKSLIVPVLLFVTPKIQTHLSEALIAIGGHEFPILWSTLISELKSSLEKANLDDFYSVNSTLSAVNSLYKKFVWQLKSIDLKDCYDNFCAFLLTTIENISRKIITFDTVFTGILCELIEALRVCFRIFCSLKNFNVPELFSEDNACKWVNELQSYWMDSKNCLTSTENGGARDLPLAMESMRRYMVKGERLFRMYLKEFVDTVRSLIVDTSEKCEPLTVTSIKFLIVIYTSICRELFFGERTIQQITESIVLPNVMLRDEDEKLFEMNYVEFIKRDMEESDLDTRRRIACELLKAIAINYKEKVAKVVSPQINEFLALFAEKPAANWKYKECAIHLVVSLSTKDKSGASVSNLVKVESFFKSAIVPELLGQDATAFPMLKAVALKFFTTFCVLIHKPDKPIAMAHLGDVVRFVGSEYNVVRSYAATCIEKLLLVKYDQKPRYTSVDLHPILPDLMENLFGAFEKPDSEDNQYVMRCITSVQMADPTNPVFNRCLFEGIVRHVEKACEKNPHLFPAFETCLVPSLPRIVGKDFKKVLPYIFQLIAHLLDLKKCSDLPEKYMGFFKLIVLPHYWKNSTYFPALVLLFQSFLQHSPKVLERFGSVECAVKIVKKLVSSGNEHWGFHILNPVIENVRYDVLVNKINNIWYSLSIHLRNNKTLRLVRGVIIFMSLFLVKHRTRKLVGLINNSDLDMVGSEFHVILREYWIPYLKTITGHMEIKLCVVASTKIICESASLVDPSAEELWGNMLDGIVTLLLLLSQEDKPEVADLGEATDYQILTNSVRLYYVGKEETLKEFEDPRHFAVGLLANLSSRYRGRFPPVIKKYLSPLNQDALDQLCTSCDRVIV